MREALECAGDEAVVGPFAALFAGDESGFGEDLEVVGDGGLAEAYGFGEVADAGFLAGLGGNDGDEPDAGGVAEGTKDGGRPFGGLGVERAGSDGRAANGRGFDDAQGLHGSRLCHTY